jgi:hypothetical protein
MFAVGPEKLKCPFCAEWIRYEARVCPHCQRDVEEHVATQRGERERSQKANSRALLIGLAVIVTGVIAGIVVDERSRVDPAAYWAHRNDSIAKAKTATIHAGKPRRSPSPATAPRTQRRETCYARGLADTTTYAWMMHCDSLNP